MKPNDEALNSEPESEIPAGMRGVRFPVKHKKISQASKTSEAEPAPNGVVAKPPLGYQTFPTGTLPKPLQDYVFQGALAIGCDEVFIALPLLAAIGAAIGNSRRLEIKGTWHVPAILWAVVVGESGSLKSPALRAVMKPLRKKQAVAIAEYESKFEDYRQELSEWKKTQKSIGPEPRHPICNRFIVSDTTVEGLCSVLKGNPRGLLLCRDELSGWLSSFDRYQGKKGVSTDAATWLTLYNGDEITIDRKGSGPTPTVINIPSAAVGITGGIQPEILRKALGSENYDNGLAARLLMAYPPRKAKVWTDAEIDPGLEESLFKIFCGLLELESGLANKPGIVHLTTEAREDFIRFYNSHGEEQKDLMGDLAAAWAKLEETAARLALIIHLVRVITGEITKGSLLDQKSMAAGIALIEWFKGETRRVLAILDETEGERDIRRLIDWLSQRDKPVTARVVQQGCRWLKNSGEAENALEALAANGYGTWEQSPSAQRGHPSRGFKLTRVSTVYGNSVFSEKKCNTVDSRQIDNPKPQGVRQSGELFTNECGPYGERG